MKKINLAPVHTAITDQCATINAATNTLADSRLATQDLAAAPFDPITWAGLATRAALANATDRLAALNETLTAPLMHVATRYVITDTRALTSPAGFHPDTNIYNQTMIAIHTDDPKQKTPRTSAPLYLHTIRNPEGVST